MWNQAKHSDSNWYFNAQLKLLNNHEFASGHWKIWGFQALKRGADRLQKAWPLFFHTEKAVAQKMQKKKWSTLRVFHISQHWLERSSQKAAMVCNTSWQNSLKFMRVKFKKHLSSRMYVYFFCVSHLKARVCNSNQSLVAYDLIFVHILNLRVIEASAWEHSQPRVIKAPTLEKETVSTVPRYC